MVMMVDLFPEARARLKKVRTFKVKGIAIKEPGETRPI